MLILGDASREPVAAGPHTWEASFSFSVIWSLYSATPGQAIQPAIGRYLSAATPGDQSQDRRSYRDEWLVIIRNNSYLSISELRRLKPSVYAWLYRHDKAWLFERLPLKKKGVINRERVNWKERDQQLAREVQTAANEIMNGSTDKLMRVTKTEIGRRIGKLPLLFKMLHKLPETAKQLDKVVESVEEFQTRRIKLKAAELRKTSAVIKQWELIRASGLKKKFVEIHREQIDSLTVR